MGAAGVEAAWGAGSDAARAAAIDVAMTFDFIGATMSRTELEKVARSIAVTKSGRPNRGRAGQLRSGSEYFPTNYDIER